MASIESILTETRVFPPAGDFVKQANVSGMDAYQALCRQAETDYEGFWADQARRTIDWNKPFSRTLDESAAPFYKWFDDGELNVSYNCLDRHLATRGDKTALIFEADDGTATQVTYKELHARVCQFANGLKSLGVEKGDRVIVYMPMSIEAVVAMQACARIGAIHSVVFGGFSAKSLFERIEDARAKIVITADESLRGGKAVPLKHAVDEALAMGDTACVEKVVVYRRSGGAVNWGARDLWWHELVQTQADTCEPVWVSAEHPLFILYTSGSTG
ncbi:MAG: acetyl-coenzyme A synthetase, partial [Betaproteobacteria bacterium HGW-Betaproteobacteria-17]